jgi:hypothetical protein
MTLSAVNIALGVCFFLFLLLLPSDPDRAVIGRYSRERFLLISGILVATVALVAFALASALNQNWRASFGTRLFGRRGLARRYLPLACLLAMALSLVPLLFFPTRLEGLTTFHYIRLAPYLLWPWAFLASLAVVPWILEARPRLHVTPRGAEGIALIGLFLVSYATRAPLSGYGLPYQSVWDEVVTYTRALELLSGRTILQAGMVPGYGRVSYGDPLTFVTAAGQAAGLFATLRSGQVTGIESYSAPAAGVATVFEAVHESGIPLRYPRLVFALLGAVCPVLIYLILRRHFGVSPWVSLAGGLIFAIFSPSVIYFSSFILPDSLATTLAMAAVLAGLEVLHSPGEGWIAEAASGVLAGMAVSVSIRYLALIAMPFLALLLARNRQRWPRRLALIVAGLGLGFLATSPTLVIDLPGYLSRLTDFSWLGDDSLPNRVISLSFYLRGAFLGQGLGLVVLGLALVGYVIGLGRHRRTTLFLTLLALVHALLITPTTFRVDRHALVLYPLAAMYAALGLGFAEGRLAVETVSLRARGRGAQWLAPGLLIVLAFLLVSLPKIGQTMAYIADMRSFQPSQVRMAEYIRSNLEPGTKIGLLEIVPFADVHLQSSGAEVHRLRLSATMEELRQEGFEYVIGTEITGHEFGETRGTIWASEFLRDDENLFEVGNDGFRSRGYPVTDVVLYLARVPPTPAP